MGEEGGKFGAWRWGSGGVGLVRRCERRESAGGRAAAAADADRRCPPVGARRCRVTAGRQKQAAAKAGRKRRPAPPVLLIHSRFELLFVRRYSASPPYAAPDTLQPETAALADGAGEGARKESFGATLRHLFISSPNRGEPGNRVSRSEQANACPLHIRRRRVLDNDEREFLVCRKGERKRVRSCCSSLFPSALLESQPRRAPQKNHGVQRARIDHDLVLLRPYSEELEVVLRCVDGSLEGASAEHAPHPASAAHHRQQDICLRVTDRRAAHLRVQVSNQVAGHCRELRDELAIRSGDARLREYSERSAGTSRESPSDAYRRRNDTGEQHKRRVPSGAARGEPLRLFSLVAPLR